MLKPLKTLRISLLVAHQVDDLSRFFGSKICVFVAVSVGGDLGRENLGFRL